MMKLTFLTKKIALIAVYGIVVFASSCFYQSEVEELPSIQVLTTEKNTSIRALSVIDEQQAWVGGSNGWIGKTRDRGQNWIWTQVAALDSLDFRTLYAFDSLRAIIANAGSPLRVFETHDGGKVWNQVYEDTRSEIFIDGIDFWDEGKGLMYGDPINGLLQLLFTDDYGLTWEDISLEANQQMAKGEASFAASGTGIRAGEGGKVWISTGGAKSRVLFSADYGKKWSNLAPQTPIIQGESSQGIFSIAVSPSGDLWAVGGDYLVDTVAEKVGARWVNQQQKWEVLEKGPFGYRSGIELIHATSGVLVACGTSGVDLSTDGGLHWSVISNEGFHVVRKSRSGNWILLAGSNGRIAELTFSNSIH